ncbi:MAG: MFS transporter, partial [Bacteroidia bacterium]|nr:MFS transporter [Bacteroidia bacterium]
KFPQLTLGMLAIFIYVGVEVTIQSNMGALLRLPEFGGYDEKSISPFISLYWGSLMIGRWTGAVSVFNLKGVSKTLALVIVPFAAFAVVLYVNYLHGSDAAKLFPYAISILVMIATMFFAGDNQEKALIAFSLLGLAAMTIGLLTTGETALFAFISGGLACSVLWPCIFIVALM